MVGEAQVLLAKDIKVAWKEAGREPRDADKEVQLRVMGLPHFRYGSDGYDQGVQHLRSLFKDSAAQHVSRWESHGLSSLPFRVPLT